MKTLITAVFIVVAGLTATAQRFTLPQGPDGLKSWFSSNVTHVSVLLQSTNSVGVMYPGPFDYEMAWADYSAEKGDLTDFANQLVGKAVADLLARASQESNVAEVLPTLDYTITVTVVNPKRTEDRWYRAFGRTTSKPFRFRNTASGTWEVIGGPITVDESRLYGGEFSGSPNSMVVLNTSNTVKWVEYRIWGTSLRVDKIETSGVHVVSLTRTGWPPGCWAEKPLDEGGLIGNGHTYVYASRIHGERLLGEFLEHYERAFATNPNYVPVSLVDAVTLWYDEDRRVGDEWTVTASLTGLAYGWRQIGYTSNVFEVTPEKELNVTLVGYEPEVEYVIESVATLSDVTLTKKSEFIGTVKADKGGKVSFTRQIDPNRVSEFFVVRKYSDDRVSVSSTSVP